MWCLPPQCPQGWGSKQPDWAHCCKRNPPFQKHVWLGCWLLRSQEQVRERHHFPFSLPSQTMDCTWPEGGSGAGMTGGGGRADLALGQPRETTSACPRLECCPAQRHMGCRQNHSNVTTGNPYCKPVHRFTKALCSRVPSFDSSSDKSYIFVQSPFRKHCAAINICYVTAMFACLLQLCLCLWGASLCKKM